MIGPGPSGRRGARPRRPGPSVGHPPARWGLDSLEQLAECIEVPARPRTPPRRRSPAASVIAELAKGCTIVRVGGRRGAEVRDRRGQVAPAQVQAGASGPARDVGRHRRRSGSSSRSSPRAAATCARTARTSGSPAGRGPRTDLASSTRRSGARPRPASGGSDGVGIGLDEHLPGVGRPRWDPTRRPGCCSRAASG